LLTLSHDRRMTMESTGFVRWRKISREIHKGSEQSVLLCFVLQYRDICSFNTLYSDFQMNLLSWKDRSTEAGVRWNTEPRNVKLSLILTFFLGEQTATRIICIFTIIHLTEFFSRHLKQIYHSQSLLMSVRWAGRAHKNTFKHNGAAQPDSCFTRMGLKYSSVCLESYYCLHSGSPSTFFFLPSDNELFRELYESAPDIKTSSIKADWGLRSAEGKTQSFDFAFVFHCILLALRWNISAKKLKRSTQRYSFSIGK